MLSKKKGIIRKSKKYSKMNIICHRGASSQFPENTHLAIKHCLEYGCSGSEIDIQLTKDKKIIILHDITLERTSIGIMPNIKMDEKKYKEIVTTPVNNLFYKDIKKINVSSENMPECVPLLSNILKYIVNYPLFYLIIEISGSTHGKKNDLIIIPYLYNLLKKFTKKFANIYNQIKFISFGKQVLSSLISNNFFSKFEIYLILTLKDIKNDHSIEKYIQYAKKLSLSGLDLEANQSKFFSKIVKKIKKNGLKIITWASAHPTQSINDGNIISLYQNKIGIDYFTSNMPNSMIYNIK